MSKLRVTCFAPGGNSTPIRAPSTRRGWVAVPSTVACQSGYQFSATTSQLGRVSAPVRRTVIDPGFQLVSVAVVVAGGGSAAPGDSTRAVVVSGRRTKLLTGKR